MQNLKFRKVFEIEHKWMALNTELTVVTITTQESAHGNKNDFIPHGIIHGSL